MNSIQSLQNVVEYIEKNLGNQFDLDTLSNQCHLSPFYFHRLFTKTAGVTVFDYIKKRRLTIAAQKIISGEKNITDISSTVGYANYEQFSRDFKHMFSTTPREIQKTKASLIFEPKLDFKLCKNIIGENETAIFDQMSVTINVVHQDEILAVGLSKLVGLTHGISESGMLWRTFHENNLTDQIPNQPDSKIGLGVVITNYIENGVAHGNYYIAGCQVNSFGSVPDDLAKHTIPAGLYAVCRVEAESFQLLVEEIIYKVFGYMAFTWLPENGKYDFSKDFNIEKYYPQDDPNDPACYFDYIFPVSLK